MMAERSSQETGTQCPENSDFERLLRAEGDLPQEFSRTLEAHLSRCQPCRHRLEAIAATPSSIDLYREYASWNAMAAGDLEPVVERSSTGEFLEKAESVDWFRERELKDLLDPAEDSAFVGKINDLEVLELLGQGGMGIVLRARDPKLDREVAVKMLKPSLGKRPGVVALFEDEARTVAAMAHEHILPIHQVADHKGLPYFVMPLVTGATLAGRLRVEGPPPFEETLRILLRVSRALEAAHNAGVIHGDLKPGNILFGGTGGDADAGEKYPFSPSAMWLADFGLGRRLKNQGAGTANEVVRKPGAGTPGYVAPEVASGGRPGVKSDLYGLGRMLETMVEKKSSYVPGWYRELIGEMTHESVANRPESVSAVIRRLEKGMEVLIARTSRGRLWSKFRRTTGIVLLVLALINGVAVASDKMFGTSYMNFGLRVLTGRSFSIEGEQGVYPDLESAVAAAGESATIVISGEGPFITSPIVIQNKNITIRAAENLRRRPVIQSHPQIVDNLLYIQIGTMRLEGIEFRKELEMTAQQRNYESTIGVIDGELEMVDCKISRNDAANATGLSLIGAGHKTRRIALRNCELVGQDAAGIRFSSFGLIGKSEILLEDCRLSGQSWLLCEASEGSGRFVRKIETSELNIHAKDCRVRGQVGMLIRNRSLGKLKIHLDTGNCLIENQFSFVALPGGDGSALREILEHEDRRSIFANLTRFPITFSDPFESARKSQPAGRKHLDATWRMFWNIEEDEPAPEWSNSLFADEEGWEIASDPE